MKLSAVAALFACAACASPPFSYAEDRCTGAFNQCRSRCGGAPDGPSRAACDASCLDREQQCRAVGAPSPDETLSQDALIARARSEREKQQAYEDWKRARAKENAAPTAD